MPTRKIKASPVKVTGYAPDGQQFESHLEEDFFVLLRFKRNVESWESNPVTIDWADADGRRRKYTPDVLVKYLPEEPGEPPLWILCEIKPDLDAESELPRRRLPRTENEEENHMKWEAAARYAARRGWTFKVFRESDIRTPYLRNARFLLRFRERKHSMHGQQQLMEILKQFGPMSLERWVGSLGATPEARSDLWPTCYHLIGEGYVKVDLTQLLSLDSICEYGQ